MGWSPTTVPERVAVTTTTCDSSDCFLKLCDDRRVAGRENLDFDGYGAESLAFNPDRLLPDGERELRFAPDVGDGTRRRGSR